MATSCTKKLTQLLMSVACCEGVGSNSRCSRTYLPRTATNGNNGSAMTTVNASVAYSLFGGGGCVLPSPYRTPLLWLLTIALLPQVRNSRSLNTPSYWRRRQSRSVCTTRTGSACTRSGACLYFTRWSAPRRPCRSCGSKWDGPTSLMTLSLR